MSSTRTTTALRPESDLRDLARLSRCSTKAAGGACSTSSSDELLTPVGLRSLSREHPDYKPHYDGDLRSRDAAYHQGTVWGWLIGPFIDAWLKVHPPTSTRARHFLDGFRAELGDVLHRHDQRSLRRRAAVHAARLRRAGVERRGGAAGADEVATPCSGTATFAVLLRHHDRDAIPERTRSRAD